MWKRSDLKRNAKTALKANYLKCMLAGIILLFAAGSQTIGGSSTSTVQDASDAYYQSLALMDGTQSSENPVLNDTLYLNTDGELTPDGYQAIYAQAEGLIQDPSLRMLRRFVMGPMQVIWDSISGFLGGAASLLLMLLGILVLDPIDIFVLLWSLLLFIPGIIKSYEYRMVPYILAEHPEMPRREVFLKSREMMSGEKWNAFKLDWSFFFWDYLSILTFGLAGIFFVYPYEHATNAELYLRLKGDHTWNADGYRTWDN